MKNFRPALYFLTSVLLMAFSTSCSGPKQVFYFQNDPAMPKVAAKESLPKPAFSASNTPLIAALPRTTFTTTPEARANANATAPATISKKDLRKLLWKTLKDIKDSTDTRRRNSRVAVSANKDRLAQLEAEARDLKNSVRVQDNDKKVTVDMQKPATNFSQTELILLGIAALLVLLLLLSIPVIGQLLGIVLALAVIALAVALLTGIIDINI